MLGHELLLKSIFYCPYECLASSGKARRDQEGVVLFTSGAQKFDLRSYTQPPILQVRNHFGKHDRIETLHLRVTINKSSHFGWLSLGVRLTQLAALEVHKLEEFSDVIKGNPSARSEQISWDSLLSLVNPLAATVFVDRLGRK